MEVCLEHVGALLPRSTNIHIPPLPLPGDRASGAEVTAWFRVRSQINLAYTGNNLMLGIKTEPVMRANQDCTVYVRFLVTYTRPDTVASAPTMTG